MISPNETIRADDFIYESEKDVDPAEDEGRVPKLEEDAKLSPDFLHAINTVRLTAGENLTKGDAVFMAEPILHRHDLNTNGTDLGEDFTNGTYWRSNTYTVPNITNKLFIKKMQLWFDKGGRSSGGTNLGTYTLYIYAVDGSDKPTGSPLFTSNDTTVNTFYTNDGWITMTFSSVCELTPNTKYAFVFKYVGTDSNDNSNLIGGGSPTGFVTSHSSSNGTTWSGGSGAFRLKMDYYVGDSNRLYKTDAKYFAMMDFLGFVLKDVTAGNQATIQTAGKIASSGLTANSFYYLSNTAGAISTSAGNISRKIAKATATTELAFGIRGVHFNKISISAYYPFPHDGFLYSDGVSNKIYTDADVEIGDLSTDGIMAVKKGWYCINGGALIDAIKII